MPNKMSYTSNNPPLIKDPPFSQPSNDMEKMTSQALQVIFRDFYPPFKTVVMVFTLCKVVKLIVRNIFHQERYLVEIKYLSASGFDYLILVKLIYIIRNLQDSKEFTYLEASN